MQQISNKSKVPTTICFFCKHTEDNEVLYGKFYTMEDIMIHYFCLLLSSNIEQNGADDEGILGFLSNDIRKEQRRSQRYLCSYCHRGGATICCSASKCKKVFHLPCGLKRGSLHQFFGQYKSYCSSHRPIQRVPAPVLKQLQTGDINCTICFEEVPPTLCRDNLWAPCCSKNTWFHRNCLQAFAMSSGYFFKCPTCNDKSHFEKAMLQYGIFIPEQDASWELVPHAYEELLHRHNRCDAPVCKCTKGREYSDAGTRWDIILCKFCGAQGVHKACSGEKWNSSKWECQDCIKMLQKQESPQQPVNEQGGDVPLNNDDNLSRASSSNTVSPPPEYPAPSEQPQEEDDDIIVIEDKDEKNIVPTTGRIVEVSSSNAFDNVKDDHPLESNNNNNYYYYQDDEDEDDVIVIDDSDGEDSDVSSRLSTPTLISMLTRNSIPAQPALARSTSSMPAQPAFARSQSSIPAQPAFARSTSNIPAQPAFARSTSNIPAQPAFARSTSSIPAQPALARSASSIPAQPALARSASSIPVQPALARTTSVIQSTPGGVSYPNSSFSSVDSAALQSGPNRNRVASHSVPERNSNAVSSAPARYSVATPSVSSSSNTVAPSGPSSSRVVNPPVPARSSASDKNSDFVIGKDGAAIEVVHVSNIPLNGRPLQVEGDVNVTTQPSSGSVMFMYQQPCIVHSMPTATAFIPQTVSEFMAAKKRKLQ